MTAWPTRVRLLNDYEVVVAGLRSMLEPYADRIDVVELDVTGTADTPVDITLYDTFGRDRVADDPVLDVTIADPTVGSLVVYSWNTQRGPVERALEKGCRGYLDKALAASELVDRLERIAAGEVVTSPPTGTDPDTGTPRGAWPGQREGLTAREAEIVAFITQGFTNPEIADRSYITLNSLKTYIRSAYRKMGVERRSQAVRWGLEHGMLPSQDD